MKPSRTRRATMTHVTDKFELQTWLDQAFRGDIPENIAILTSRQSKFENVVEEMLTQLAPETRPVVEKLYEMHEADTQLMYEIMAELFKRHLEDHP
jgi:hypothetical protein